jgi:hypothetical protein
MKQLTNIEWVSLAKSDDKYRLNLCEVYRDKHHLVATDGFRLHCSNGLPEVSPHFPSGLDAEFPNWQAVIPKEEFLIETLDIVATTKFLRTLKATVTFCKSIKLRPIARVEFQSVYHKPQNSTDFYATFSLQTSWQVEIDNFRLRVKIANETCKIFDNFGINLAYLNDALSMPTIRKLSLYRGDDKTTNVATIVAHDDDRSRQAIIMPVLLKDEE